MSEPSPKDWMTCSPMFPSGGCQWYQQDRPQSSDVQGWQTACRSPADRLESGSHKDAPGNFGTCIASREAAEETMRLSGTTDVHIVKGVTPARRS